jgi:esterase/lipase
MNNLLIKIGVSVGIVIALWLGVRFALKQLVKNSKDYQETSDSLVKANLKIIQLNYLSDSLNVASLNFENKARALDNKNNQLQAKLDSFTKYNKVCYQKVLETKGFLKKKTWVFAEIPCSKIY